MGNFSYIAKNTNQAIKNPWHNRTLCEIQLVIGAKVVEKLRGIYNGYGSVLLNFPFKHEILSHNGKWIDVTESTKSRHEADESVDIWLSDTWETLVDIHFDETGMDGFAVWELNKIDEIVPLANSRSADDPDQGDVFNYYDDEEDYPEDY